MVKRSRACTVRVIATCNSCSEMWDDYKKGVALARRHAISTGHAVHVERLQVWTYNQSEKRIRQGTAPSTLSGDERNG